MNTHTSRIRTGAVLIVLILIAATTGRAVAHHSFAMYDASIERTVTGKLVRFVIGANHSQFVFDLVDENGTAIMGEDGEPQRWAVETGPAVSLARQGITVESFPIDSIFTVTLNPLRNGKPAGALRGDLVICGKVMPEGGCTETTGTVY